MMSRARYHLRESINYNPFLFYLLFNIFGKAKQRAVTQDTDIVIEGYPRSGNSFAVAAFRRSQSNQVNIATHVHTPCQVIKAAKLNIPTLVLIREPVSAVISRMSLGVEVAKRKIEKGEKLRKKRYSATFSDLFKAYHKFYSCLLPIKDSFVISSFEEIISDFSLSIARLNTRFNTNFELFDHTPENAKIIIESSNFHLGPNSLRTAIKNRLYSEYYEKQNEISDKVAKAQEIYCKFIDGVI
ncbi:MAG: hypothetical protein HC921_20345 [Synechococcaceae cyanobacterium SM2_3_1]|nr:hypothetical protein [Synechococcaceae cyanobacterium SM2_3_1]